MRGAWVLLVVASTAGAHADPLDKAFEAKPSDLLAAARGAATLDADIVVLRDDATLVFDEAGRAERHNRTVFLVAKQAGVDGWGTVELEYQPFYQDKPVVRARVIGKDGQSAELDRSLITDAPAVTDSPQVYSDRRTMQAPLPRLAVGSVVEQEVTIKDREPLLRAGIVEHQYVGRYVPVRRTVITITAPPNRIRVLARGFAKAPVPQKTTAAKLTTWRYELGETAPFPPSEVSVPSDILRFGSIGMATAPSWAAVATDYNKLVEDRLAQPGLAAPAVRGANQRETVERAVAWLHAHVRYTGIEFSNSAIVPWAPAEVTKRGFGDCKDKASLLVAVLRASGVHADLALLSTGPGVDVDRELPGMGDFDHAIVRAKVDGKDVWIDATESMLPAGQLPARDQGRLALIVASDTKDLVTIPRSAPADNVIYEVRTFHLAEHDAATLTEVSREKGTFADNQRNWYANTRHDELEKTLGKYVEHEYKGKLGKFTATDPADAAVPFELTLEITNIDRAITGRNNIDVYLFPTDAFAHVPAAIKEDRDPRRFPFEWFQPHQYVIENRLVVPSGYGMPELVAHEEQAIGTMKLTTDRHIERDTVVVTYRLDTGKARLSPDEVKSTHEAVKQLFQREGEHVQMSLTSWTLLQQKKIPEAIAECQRLIALHPKEALHWDQLSDVYRDAGMGIASRRAARQGVAVEPTASDAHDILAFELRHDSMGRDFGFDMDRKSAIAEYRKALELNPKHLGALVDFATLLNRDDAGHLTTNQHDLEEAAGLWRRAKEIEAGHKYDQQLATDLVLAGKVADAEAVAKAMTESDHRQALLVATAALQHGTAPALRIAGSDSNRKAVVYEAANMLALLRRYDLSSVLYGEAADSSTDPNQAAIQKRITRVDPTKIDPKDPRTPALLAIGVALGMRPPIATPWDDALGKRLPRVFGDLQHIPGMSSFRLIPVANTLDIVFAMAQPSVEADGKRGWRVTLDFGPVKERFYVVSDQGKAKLIAAAEIDDGLGAAIHGFIAKGDLQGAAKWMQWAMDDLDLPRTSGEFGYRVAWKAEQGKPGFPSKDLLEVGAALMMADLDPKGAIPILQRCPVAQEDLQKECLVRLALALRTTHRMAEVLDVAKKLTERDPSDFIGPSMQGITLAELGRAKEARELLDARLAKDPDNIRLLDARATVGVIANDPADARTWFDKEAEHPSAKIKDINKIAWTRLYYDASPADARRIATRGERMERSLSAGFLNTLAAIEAESDHPFAAWQYLERTLAKRLDGKPNEEDWFVFGRIAEAYGLRDDALAAYQRIPKPKHTEPTSPGAYEFIQKRLPHLKAH